MKDSGLKEFGHKVLELVGLVEANSAVPCTRHASVKRGCDSQYMSREVSFLRGHGMNLVLKKTTIGLAIVQCLQIFRGLLLRTTLNEVSAHIVKKPDPNHAANVSPLLQSILQHMWHRRHRVPKLKAYWSLPYRYIGLNSPEDHLALPC
jgi:hypothetical protein